MASRVPLPNASPSGPVTNPRHVSAANLTAAGISGHTVEKWGDHAYWDVTANTPVCVDKMGLTGTPRSQD